ncbi:MAG: hypothetical protein GX786_06205 [Clostridiales bacterium]|nr:hypothetical protein [Clostridiales bacterium]
MANIPKPINRKIKNNNKNATETCEKERGLPMIMKALFPIDSFDKLEKMLIKITNLQNHAEAEKHGLAVESVFMGEVVQVLKEGNKTYETFVKELERRGVILAVCKNAMKAFGLTEEKMVPSSQVVVSGVGETIYKQMEGWGVYWC